MKKTSIFSRYWLPGSLILCAATALNLQAVSIVFQDGAAIPELGIGSYSGTEDTTLISGSNAGRNYGGSNSIWIGNSAGAERKTLLRFDLSSLMGQAASIDSVTLTMFQIAEGASNNGAEVDVNLYQIQSANGGWVEGTGSGSAQAGSSSWNYKANATVSWAGSAGLSTSGTDYVASAIDGTKTIIAKTGSGGTYTWNLPVSLIQSWIDGENTGLLFAATDFGSLEDNDFFRFASSLYTTSNLRPMLTVNYTPIPEPGMVVLLGLGILAVCPGRRTRNV